MNASRSAPGLGATAASKSASSVLVDALAESDPELAKLPRKAIKKRVPGSRWDGRVAGMSVQEYRELKWSTDAGFRKIQSKGSGPSYSIRPTLPTMVDLQKRSTNFQTGDVYKSMAATLPIAPSWSCGMKDFKASEEKSPGPTEYRIKSTMDPNSHPTCSKHTGPRFGTETLLASDGSGLPGPGEYDVMKFEKSSVISTKPKYTIQGREAWRAPTAAPGPGIGEYKYEQAMRYGKNTPIHWSMQGKTEPLAKPRGSRRYISPGPPHYNPPGAGAKNEKVNKNKEPVWKFGTEHRGLV